MHHNISLTDFECFGEKICFHTGEWKERDFYELSVIVKLSNYFPKVYRDCFKRERIYHEKSSILEKLQFEFGTENTTPNFEYFEEKFQSNINIKKFKTDKFLPKNIPKRKEPNYLLLGEESGGRTCFLYQLFYHIEEKFSHINGQEAWIPLYISLDLFDEKFRKFQSDNENSIESSDSNNEKLLKERSNFIFEFLLSSFLSNAQLPFKYNDHKRKINVESKNLSPFERDDLQYLLKEKRIYFIFDDFEKLSTTAMEYFFFRFQGEFSSITGNKYIKLLFSANLKSVDNFLYVCKFSPSNISSQNDLHINRVELANFIQKKYRCVHIRPGKGFDILTQNSTDFLFKRWKMIEKNILKSLTENNFSPSNSLPQILLSTERIGPSQWIAFESAVRAHRIKLFPVKKNYPILIYLLSKRLSSSTVSDEGFICGTDRLFSINDLFEDIFDQEIRKYYENYKKQKVKSNFYHNLLIDTYELNISQLKILCSLVSYLCHWYEYEARKSVNRYYTSTVTPGRSTEPNPPVDVVNIQPEKKPFSLRGRSISESSVIANSLQTNDQKTKTVSPLPLISLLSHRSFIQYQLKNILSTPGTASYLGFTIHVDEENVHSTDNDYDKRYINLSDDQALKLVNEIFNILPEMYKVADDGFIYYRHIYFQEFLTARFLTEPPSFISMIMNSLFTTFSINSQSNKFLFSIRKKNQKINPLTMRNLLQSADPKHDNNQIHTFQFHLFNWSKSRYLTSLWWDNVIQFAGIRRGLQWSIENILSLVPNTPSITQNNKIRRTPSIPVAQSAPSLNTKLSPTSSSPNNQLRLSSSSLIQSKTQITLLLEKWYKKIKKKNDLDDIGQVRFQIILRIYSTICNHRSSMENVSDPATEIISQIFMKLVEFSINGAFLHLELFPCYFLSAFTPITSQFIVKKLIQILYSRLFSYEQLILIFSYLYFSAYSQYFINEFIEKYNSFDPPVRLSILFILQRIDNFSLEKNYVKLMLMNLIDPHPLIQNEVFKIIKNIGNNTAKDIPHIKLTQLLLSNEKKDRYAIQNLINSAIKFIKQLIEAKRKDKLKENSYLSHFYNHLHLFIGLVSESNAGTRLLAFLVFGCQNFIKSKSDLEKGYYARKSAFLLCTKIHQLYNPVPIFEPLLNHYKNHQNHHSEENLKNTQNREKKNNTHNKYSFIVSISSLINSTLGENAACWTSSVLKLLCYKFDLLKRVNVDAFILLDQEKRLSLLKELLTGTEDCISIEMQFLMILLEINPTYYFFTESSELFLNYFRAVVFNESLPFNYRKLSIQMCKHICFYIPNAIPLQFISEIILLCEEPELHHESIAILNQIHLHSQLSFEVDIQSILSILLINIKQNFDFVTISALELIKVFSISSKDAMKLPVIQILTTSSMLVKQSLISLIGKIPHVFYRHIPDIFNLLNTRVNETLDRWQAALIRSVAISSLISFCNNSFHQQVIDQIIGHFEEDYANNRTKNQLNPKESASFDSFYDKKIDIQIPYYYLEGILQLLRQIDGVYISNQLKQFVVINFINHPKSQLQKLILECLGNFGSFSLQEKYLTILLDNLINKNNEIQITSENTLIRLSKSLFSSFPRYLIEDYIKKYSEDTSVAAKDATLKILNIVDIPMLEESKIIVIKLLNDTNQYIRTESLDLITKIAPSTKTMTIFLPFILHLLKSDNSLQFKKKAIKLLRLNSDIASQVVDLASTIILRKTEPLELKLQSVLLLCKVDALFDTYTSPIIDFMMSANDDVSLAQIFETFEAAGYPFVKIIPKIISQLKQSHYIPIKRKLLHFIAPHHDAALRDYLYIYHSIITMAGDSDHTVKKFAVQLMNKMSIVLPNLHQFNKVSMTILKSFIKEFCSIFLNEKNDEIRRKVIDCLIQIGNDNHILRNDILSRLVYDNYQQKISVWQQMSREWHVIICKPT